MCNWIDNKYNFKLNILHCGMMLLHPQSWDGLNRVLKTHYLESSGNKRPVLIANQDMHNKQYGEYFERLVYLTETRWPNEYDQNRWIWSKNTHRRTLTFELDRNFTTMTNINVWIWPKIYIKNKYYHNDDNCQIKRVIQVST